MVPAVHVLAGVLSALTLPALPTLQSTDAATWASVRQVAAGERVRVELIRGAYFYPAIGAGALVGATLPATAWQTVYLLAPQ